jgi:hypothetical protein
MLSTTLTQPSQIREILIVALVSRKTRANPKIFPFRATIITPTRKTLRIISTLNLIKTKLLNQNKSRIR